MNSIRPIHNGPSWLSVKVTAPQYFDLAHFDSITNKNNALALEYTVDLLPPEKQSLFHNEDKQFYEMYHFVRNLEDNEAALNQTLVSTFPRSFGVGSVCVVCLCHVNYLRNGIRNRITVFFFLFF